MTAHELMPMWWQDVQAAAFVGTTYFEPGPRKMPKGSGLYGPSGCQPPPCTTCDTYGDQMNASASWQFMQVTRPGPPSQRCGCLSGGGVAKTVWVSTHTDAAAGEVLVGL